MKHILILFLIIFPLNCIIAQDSIRVDVPRIITKVKIGKKAKFNTKSIRFIEAKDDSRCPSDVTCVWPGEVIAVIGIYEGDSLVEKKEFVFGIKSINPDNPEEILVTEKDTIFGYNISPYPISTKQIKPTEYFLELLIK